MLNQRASSSSSLSIDIASVEKQKHEGANHLLLSLNLPARRLAIQAAALKYSPQDMQVATKELADDGLDGEANEDCLPVTDLVLESEVSAGVVPSAAKVDRQQSARASRLRVAPLLKKIQSVICESY